MAGYNRGIVATRKLNEKNKARLKSTGDTEFGFIKGRLSHINKEEKARLTAADAYDISLRERVESDIAEKGAGTINPYTDMPEYTHIFGAKHDFWDRNVGGVVDAVTGIGNPATGAINMYENISGQETGINTLGELIDDPSKKMIDVEQVGENLGIVPPEEDPGLFQGTGAGQKSYDELQAMTPEERAEYTKTEFGIGEGYEQYMTGFQQEPFGFLGESKDLSTRGLESTYGATMGALGSQQTALGRTTGRGLREAGRGRDIAASRSGLASSGTITQAYETQKKDLFQDYTAGMKDIGRQRGTALESLTLGKEGADLGFRTGTYTEQQRQLEQYYDDIGLISGSM